MIGTSSAMEGVVDLMDPAELGADPEEESEEMDRGRERCLLGDKEERRLEKDDLEGEVDASVVTDVKD